MLPPPVKNNESAGITVAVDEAKEMSVVVTVVPCKSGADACTSIGDNCAMVEVTVCCAGSSSE